MASAELTDLNAARPFAGEALPEFWDEGPPPLPPRAVWIPWPLAVMLVPLLWVFPKRMGLHLGRVAWPGVIAGHLLWTAYGIGSVYLAFAAPQTGLPGYIAQAFQPEAKRQVWPITFSEAVRSPAALLAAATVEQCASSTEAFLLLIGGTILAVAGIGAVGGGLLMPWAAAGDRRWHLFLRCAKLTLWSTSSVVVLGLVLQTVALMLAGPDARGVGSELSDIAWILGPLAVALWLWIWIRSGFRCAGPRQGPDFEPRRPRCEACGYVLTGLTTASNCPECGLSAASSMPTHRHFPAFAAARTRRGRIAGYFGTLVRVVFDADFFRRIRLRNGFAPARRFALWSAALCGPAAFATYWLMQFVLPKHAPVPQMLSIQLLQALLITWLGVALLIIVVTSLSLEAALLRSWAFRPRAVVVFYTSAWAWQLASTVALVVQVSSWVSGEMAFWKGWSTMRLVPLCVAAAAWALPAAQLVVLQRRIRHALRSVRFTNA